MIKKGCFASRDRRELRSTGLTIVQLTASGDFDEALALCKLLPPEDAALRSSKESSIHMRFGHYLFENGNYEEAMEQFLASQVDITYVFSLYPSVILPQKTIVAYPEKMTVTSDSSSISEETESSLTSQQMDSNEKFIQDEKKMSYNAFIALVKYLQKKRQVIIERATGEVTEEVVFDVVHLSNPLRSKVSAKNRGPFRISSISREMAIILDTALIQALLLTGQSLVALDLLKGPNYCDLKICEHFLKQNNYYDVLLELYKCNEMHR